MKPLVSIITPTFNSEKSLEKCILSIKKQKYRNIEHIIIDGKSSDNTIAIIKKHQNDYNVKWISEIDSGVADAMNKGFKMASGDICSWIDSDNFYVSDDLFEKIIESYSENTEIYLTNCWSQHEGSEKRVFVNIPADISYDTLLNKGNKLVPECVFFKKELFEKTGGFDLQYKLLADYDLWIRMFKQNPTCKKIDVISITYVANDASLLRRRPIQAWKESFRIGKEHGRRISSRVIFYIKYGFFRVKYPILKQVKKNIRLKNTLIKIFR